MQSFDHNDYRSCLQAWVKDSPRNGYGQLSKLAKSLAVSSVFITQVFKGERDFNPDQGLAAARFMELPESEIEYFLLMVHEARASTSGLKARLKSQRTKLKSASLDLKNRVQVDTELSAEAKSVFYGHWHYSAVRLTTSLEGMRTAAAISAKLQIPIERTEEILSFLQSHQLVIKTKLGWEMGPQATHLEADSPFISSRQVQWRTKGFEAMSAQNQTHLFYTGLMSLDEETFNEVRELLAKVVEKSLERIRPAPSRLLGCLNIDWFKIS